MFQFVYLAAFSIDTLPTYVGSFDWLIGWMIIVVDVNRWCPSTLAELVLTSNSVASPPAFCVALQRAFSSCDILLSDIL